MNLNVLTRFAQKMPGQSPPVFLTCLFGLGAGLAAVAFQLGINALYRVTILRSSHISADWINLAGSHPVGPTKWQGAGVGTAARSAPGAGFDVQARHELNQ